MYIFPVGKSKYLYSGHKFSVQVVFAFNFIYTHNSYGALPILFECKVFTGVNLSVPEMEFTHAVSEKYSNRKLLVFFITVTYGRSIQAA